MEAVLVLTITILSGGVVARPQQITQEVLLTPFNFVRSTGNTAISTGQQLVHSVPQAVNVVSTRPLAGWAWCRRPSARCPTSPWTPSTPCPRPSTPSPTSALSATGTALRAGATVLT